MTDTNINYTYIPYMSVSANNMLQELCIFIEDPMVPYSWEVEAYIQKLDTILSSSKPEKQ